MAWTTNDEELLILSDDSDNWSDFVLDEQIIDDNKNNSLNESIISFDTETPSFDSTSSTDSELKIESTDLGTDFSVSLDSETPASNDFAFSIDQNMDILWGETQVEETPVVIAEESSDFSFWLDSQEETSALSFEEPAKVEEAPLVSNVQATSDFSFWEEITETSSPVVEEVKDSSVWTMTDILDEAIAKFVKREELIVSDITSKEEHIKSLKAQIASLESDVNTDNEEVTRLNTEKQSIVKNRKALEKMKEVPTTTK